MENAKTAPVLAGYEAALWSVLGAMAYLARGDADFVYPDILWLFALLLATSLATAFVLRRRPRGRAAHAVGALASFAIVAGIQSRSGGARSELWVLYLLPLFSAALLLRGRELAMIAVGAAACDAALYAGPDAAFGPSVAFELAMKTGVLWAAAASTWALSEAERRARVRSAEQRAEIERMAAEARRGESLAAVGLASAATVHDLSTPLTVIRGYAAMRLDQGGLGDDLRRDFERIDRAAAFCQAVAAATLSAARGAPAGGERFDLMSALESALALSEEVLSRRGIVVRRDYADGDYAAVGNPRDLERMFLNLFGNAAKAMPRGGSLTVRLRPIAGGRFEALVEDSGTGFPEEVRATLFSAFATTRAADGGTGLGLHLCRETARRHGGDIEAENRPEGGARLRVVLPAAAGRVPA